jgi:AcrR family transcriptional regulator
MSPGADTASRLAATALQLLMDGGLRGVTGKAVADAAGVSRMTVHRYFASKETLIEAALSRLSHVFEEAIEVPERGVDETIAWLGEAIARLPRGDLPTRLAEVRAAYPEVHQRFLTARRKALDALLDQVFVEGRADGRLRSDLNQHVAEVFVQESLASLFAPNPALLGRGIKPAEIFRTVKEIILHGIVEPAAGPNSIKRSRKGAKK